VIPPREQDGCVIEPALRLREPANRVSPRARTYWTVRALAGWIVVAIPVTIVAVQAPVGWLIGTIVAVIALTHVIVMPRWRYRVHRWEATPDAVYTQTGWFNQERRIAPIARVQTVDTERGPLEQLFGLANVTVTTASAAGPVKIHGLDRADAESLAADLTARAQDGAGDGT
jgi:uncharacterized protein